MAEEDSTVINGPYGQLAFCRCTGAIACQIPLHGGLHSASKNAD
jgi:hypothetical protein